MIDFVLYMGYTIYTLLDKYLAKHLKRCDAKLLGTKELHGCFLCQPVAGLVIDWMHRSSLVTVLFVLTKEGNLYEEKECSWNVEGFRICIHMCHGSGLYGDSRRKCQDVKKEG